MGQQVVKQRMAFWVHKGVVREVRQREHKNQQKKLPTSQNNYFNEIDKENDAIFYFINKIYEKHPDVDGNIILRVLSRF